MYTQCPRCMTTFEIEQDTLRASVGIVQCGHCSERFDALRTLTDVLPADPGTQPAGYSPNERVPTLTAVASRATRLEQGSPVELAADDATGHPAPASLPDPTPPAEPADVDAPPPDSESAPAAAVFDIEPSALLDPGLFEASEGTAADGLKDLEAWLAAPATPDHAADGAKANRRDQGTEGPVTAAPEPPEYSEPVYVRPPRLGRRAVAWGAGCLVLALVLALQLAWSERANLFRDPATRPWVAGICQALPCHLPPIKDLGELDLVSRDVRPDPDTPGALTITAALRNDANFRQPWPVVVIELADIDNTPVAMRRFRPAEYVPDPDQRAAGIPPGATSAIAFTVVDPGKRAVSFHFAFE